jgi:hypothetical protein
LEIYKDLNYPADQIKDLEMEIDEYRKKIKLLDMDGNSVNSNE